MYLEHFGLREAPFRITPHTEFFFAGGNRGATLEALIYAITHDEGIVKIGGEVGSGKTMLCRMLLEKLPPQVETVYLANPSLSRDEILFAIADELGMPLPESRPHLLLRGLQERLLEVFASGRQIVILIDEAHAMPRESLEEIRLLSNLESKRHKLLQIALFGQPELDERLGEKEMRQLKERITHNFALEPLKRSDIAGYLMFRLRAAGYHGPDLFTPAAIQHISKASEGLTRRINILADKALLSAFAEATHQIDVKQVRAAIRDAQFKPMQDAGARPRTWLGIVAAGIAATAIGTTLHLAGSRAAPPAQLSTPPAAEIKAGAAGPATPMPIAATAAATAQEATAPGTDNAASAPAKLTAEHFAATAAWLKTAPDDDYVIQLLSADGASTREAESFLSNAAKTLGPQQIRVYRSSLSGRDRLGVIYGDYPSRDAASAALRQLPEPIRAARPFPRAVSKLR